MKAVLLVALGGALGAVSRYGLMLLSVRLFGAGFPIGTLIVNVAGSLAMGLLLAVIERHVALEPVLRPFLMAGFLGAFTTFSAFSLDANGLLFRGEAGLALLYVALSVMLSLGAFAGGYWFWRWVSPA